MKKPAKKKPNPPPAPRRAMPTNIEGSPADKEEPGMAEGASAEEKYDQRQAARKSRPRTI